MISRQLWQDTPLCLPQSPFFTPYHASCGRGGFLSGLGANGFCNRTRTERSLGLAKYARNKDGPATPFALHLMTEGKLGCFERSQ
jgi:hypothetical protein